MAKFNGNIYGKQYANDETVARSVQFFTRMFNKRSLRRNKERLW